MLTWLEGKTGLSLIFVEHGIFSTIAISNQSIFRFEFCFFKLLITNLKSLTWLFWGGTYEGGGGGDGVECWYFC